MKGGRSPATVGIVSTGDMGAAMGRVLIASGLRVVTCQGGRSQRTQDLAVQAGIESLASLDEVALASDLLLSLVPPARAGEVANEIARALGHVGSRLVYGDCNSIAPGTAEAVARTLSGAGATFVDVSIIGQPPRPGQVPGPGTPRFYASGPEAPYFARLGDHGLDVRVLEGGIGKASGLKMCYAALLKGLTALSTELLVAGQLLGLEEPLRAELESSQPVLLDMMRKQLPRMPPKAYRWVGEMEEMARTFQEAGLPPEIFLGAAHLYGIVEGTDLGHETPEKRRLGTTLEEVVDLLARALRSAPAGKPG